MEWILHSDVVGLYLSGKDSGLNHSEMTQVSLSTHVREYVYTLVFIFSHPTNTLKYKLKLINYSLSN